MKPMPPVQKKLTVTFLFILYTCFVMAQNADKRGYVAIGAGPDFLTGYKGSGNPGTGLNITAINFGYAFAKGFGVTASLTGGAHIFNSQFYVSDGQNTIPGSAHHAVSYGTLTIGPMYVLKLSEKSALDFKARGGRFYCHEKITLSSSALQGSEESKKYSLGYSLAVAYRLKFASRWCTYLSCDYYSGKYSSSPTTSNNTRINPISINAGLGFMF